MRSWYRSQMLDNAVVGTHREYNASTIMGNLHLFPCTHTTFFLAINIQEVAAPSSPSNSTEPLPSPSPNFLPPPLIDISPTG